MKGPDPKDSETRPPQNCPVIRRRVLLIVLGLAIMVFIVYPMLYSLRISFYDWNIINPETSSWVGLDNYQEMLSDSIFQRAVLNTLIYTAITRARTAIEIWGTEEVLRAAVRQGTRRSSGLEDRIWGRS